MPTRFRSWKTDLPAFVAAAFLSMASSAQADLLAGSTVGAAILGFERSIDRILDDTVSGTFDRLDQSVDNLRGQTEAILASARAELETVIDRTADELNAAQRRAVDAYLTALAETERAVERTLKETDHRILDTAQIIDALSPFDAGTIILGIDSREPLYTDRTGRAVIVVTGLNLAAREPRLLYDGQWIEATNPRENEVEFHVELDLPGGVSSWLDLTLELQSEGIAILGSDPRRLPISLRTWAPELGEVAMLYTVPTQPTTQRIFPPRDSAPWRNRCSASLTRRCRTGFEERVTPSRSDMEIIPGSARIIDHSTTNYCSTGWGGRRAEIRDASSNGFVVYVRERSQNSHSCTVRARVIFEERPRRPIASQRQSEFRVFRYDEKGVSFEIPVNATLVGFMLRREGGTEGAEPVTRFSDRWGTRAIWSRGDAVVELVPHDAILQH